MARSKPDKPAKKKKEPFLKRQIRHTREVGDLGRTLVVEPRAFPGKCGSLFRRSFRRLWEARGGGFYACGFLLCFVWLELNTLYREISAATGIGSFLSEQLFEFLIRFSVQSLTNTIQSFMWPVWVIERFDRWGIVGLVLGYFLFAYVLKARITAWLFSDDDRTPADASGQDASTRR